MSSNNKLRFTINVNNVGVKSLQSVMFIGNKSMKQNNFHGCLVQVSAEDMFILFTLINISQN